MRRGWDYVLFSLGIGVMLVLVRCGGDQPEEWKEPGILAGTYLAIGERFKFSDDWELQFECDCCYDEIHFDSDTTFTRRYPCLNASSMTRENYKVIENRVILNYSGHWLDTEDQSEDIEGEVEKYVHNDTIVSPRTENWRIDTLENHVVLTNSQSKTILKGLILNESQIHWTYIENVEKRFKALAEKAKQQ